ncbi:hypothetical protein F4861DRAFT_152078 [Xylaria intraflava]|nr:hypothetical protein F4861DRAFT_152078 [Xylaria intraflava]
MFNGAGADAVPEGTARLAFPRAPLYLIGSRAIHRVFESTVVTRQSVGSLVSISMWSPWQRCFFGVLFGQPSGRQTCAGSNTPTDTGTVCTNPLVCVFVSPWSLSPSPRSRAEATPTIMASSHLRKKDVSSTDMHELGEYTVVYRLIPFFATYHTALPCSQAIAGTPSHFIHLQDTDPYSRWPGSPLYVLDFRLEGSVWPTKHSSDHITSKSG